MLPALIRKAKNKITEIETNHSIESLKDNFNGFKNIERRIKSGERVPNEFSKPLYSLYRSYTYACSTVKKYNDANNIIEVENKEPSPTSVCFNDIVDSFSNRHQKLSSIRRRLFTQRSSRRTFIGGNCTFIMS